MNRWKEKVPWRAFCWDLDQGGVTFVGNGPGRRRIKHWNKL